MPSVLTELDRKLLVLALEHAVESGALVSRCHRELEPVVRLEDPHALITVSTVYNRLGLVSRRLDEAHGQLAELLGHVEQLAREQVQP